MFFRTLYQRALPHFLPMFAFVLLTLAPPLSAQNFREDPLLLPNVVVTATSAPFGRALLPTSATILSGETLREQGIRSVADALRLAPGATIVRLGGEGGQTSLFLRGGESDYVKVLVDGVPVNQAGGAVDLADLSTAQVERIEIVRGPASILYGSDAVAGVIQIFTRRGRGAPALDLTLSGGQGSREAGEGRYGVTEMEGTVTGSSESLVYSFGGGHSSSGGLYELNSDRTLTTANARVGWDGGSNTSLSLSTRFSDGVFHYPTDGAGNPVDANTFVDRRLLTVSGGATHRIGNAVRVQLEVGHTSTEQATVDDPDDVSEVDFWRSTFELQRNVADLRVTGELLDGSFTVGSGYEGSEGVHAYNSNFSEWDTRLEAERTNQALYAEYIGAPFGGVSLTVGGRVDWNETFGRFETYRIGFSRSLGEATRLRGTIGSAFREPTFIENFGSGGFDVGNPDLTPEQTRSWELGVDQSFGPLLLTATWFDQRFENLIQYSSQVPFGDPNYLNIGAAEALGVELTADMTLGALALGASFTRLDTEVLDPGISGNVTFTEGEALIRRPTNSGSLTGRWALGEGSLSGTLHFVGDREDVNFNTWPDPAVRVVLPSYTTLDLSGEHALPLIDGVETRATFRIENLLDTEYSGGFGYRAPGRVVRIGARIGVGG